MYSFCELKLSDVVHFVDDDALCRNVDDVDYCIEDDAHVNVVYDDIDAVDDEEDGADNDDDDDDDDDDDVCQS